MDTASIPDVPSQPRSVEETGLTLACLADLALKIIYLRGSIFGHEITDVMRLPFVPVVDETLEYLRRERLVEVRGSSSVGKSSYRYSILDKGHTRARELLKRSQYVGSAPVTLEAYTKMVDAQSLAGLTIPDDALRRALACLVLGDALLDQLGPAINSGKAVFLFGNTGNGKTTIAEAIGSALPGTIWVPYAIGVDDQVVRVFDARHHHPPPEKSEAEQRSGALRYLSTKVERFDQRWALVRRPLIVAGGELTLKNLNLIFDPGTKVYEAPYQMKANGGVFLIDDLGRQRMQPRTILNRWIVPLEKRVDYLTLAAGQKMDVPFDVRIIFATNLEPKDLVDEAFLRRIRYKINVPDPTWEEFREIVKREAAERNIAYSEEGCQYLIAEYYTKPRRQPRGVHPRDLLDGLVHLARFRGKTPQMTREMIDFTCLPYFLKQTDGM